LVLCCVVLCCVVLCCVVLCCVVLCCVVLCCVVQASSSSAPALTSPVLTSSAMHALDAHARRLALQHYTEQLHATTINPMQHPTQSVVVPVSRELSGAGLLGASSDLKADGRKQYRGPHKYDQSGTGRVMIETGSLALHATATASASASASSGAEAKADLSATATATATSAPAPAPAAKRVSTPSKPSSPLLARLANSPLNAPVRPPKSASPHASN
jgi:hypothetical protein